jgi:hypothetical protein
MIRYFIGALGLIFFGLGIWALVRAVLQFRAAKASGEWPSIQGMVNESKVAVINTRGGPQYLPHVKYTYIVEEQEYTSQRIYVGHNWWTSWWTSSKERVQEQLQPYREKQPISVYYNPDDPMDAVLEAGLTKGAWSTLFIGIMMTLLGGVILAIVYAAIAM